MVGRILGWVIAVAATTVHVSFAYQYNNTVSNTVTFTNNPKGTLVVFGDSAADNGNLDKAIGQQGMWYGHYSNGPMWNEFTAYMLNYTLKNYAFGGATASDVVEAPIRKGYRIPTYLDTIDWYLKDNANLTQSEKDNTVIAINHGPNTLWWGMTENNFMGVSHNIINTVAADLYKGIDMLYQGGYKKFVFINLLNFRLKPVETGPPPPGLAPEYAEKIGEYGAIAEDLMNSYIQQINLDIDLQLPRFLSKHPNLVNFTVIDNYEEVKELMHGPTLSALGITDIDNACIFTGDYDPNMVVCENPNSHYFYDQYHPNVRVQALQGIAVAEVIQGKTAPKNLAQRLIGIVKEYDLSQSKPGKNIIDTVTNLVLEKMKNKNSTKATGSA
ncbi:hypothetical protein H4219_002874 [Mycoemilia scoparia]|uniref:Uncharacterized protein n=1 Tax=Mycoemilia scoparia TaxID=417184 RepID=A0A9W8DTG5_9FUNG|nr:hypothetical protein H4219_002874 [Mycoemilia scoparia]